MPIQIEPLWWITAVEAPVVTALFWMIHGLRRDMQERIERDRVPSGGVGAMILGGLGRRVRLSRRTG